MLASGKKLCDGHERRRYVDLNCRKPQTNCGAATTLSFKLNYTFLRTNTGGYFWWARRNKHRFHDFIRGIFIFELIVRTFLLRSMGSNRVILTLEQQVDVLEEFRTIVSK